ncbi:hypothetical protein BH10PSE14_BH10PSE14_06160 [soil metagenome]
MTTDSDRQLHILQHSLGVDQYGQGERYRNHFVTGPGSTDYRDCMSLVAQGLMTRRPGSPLTGGDDLFRVTPEGQQFVTAHSPAPPKLSRSQKRYRAWLDADCGFSFAEYLGVSR